MSFDEEGDHYMSKADFAIMCDELKKAVQQRGELLDALKEIASIKNKMDGGDWDEIEEARNIAKAAIAKVK